MHISFLPGLLRSSLRQEQLFRQYVESFCNMKHNSQREVRRGAIFCQY